MATILQIAGPAASLGAGATQFFYIGQGGAGNSSGESVIAALHRTAGTYSNLYVRIIANDRGASTVRTRKNTANGNQSVSIGASTTGEFEDTTNTDSVSSGDKLNYQVSTGAGGTVFTVSIISCLFAADSNTVERFAITASGSTATFQPLGGAGSTSATEANTQTKVKTAGTLRNMLVNLSANTRTSDTTYRSRINGVNGNLIITVGAGLTGDFEDTGNTDTVAVDDLVNFSTTLAAGTGAITGRVQAVDLETTNSKWQFITSSTVTAVNPAANNTYYFALGGVLWLASTESNVAADANVAFTARGLHCRISANTVTATSTLRLRVNGVNGNQAVSIPASTTGLFEDASNSDSVTATDEVNYSLATGATGTSLTIRLIGMTGEIPAAGGTQPMIMRIATVPFLAGSLRQRSF